MMVIVPLSDINRSTLKKNKNPNISTSFFNTTTLLPLIVFLHSEAPGNDGITLKTQVQHPLD